VLDGERVGSVEMKETFETPVEPGRHTLQVRNGRNSSRTKIFDAADGRRRPDGYLVSATSWRWIFFLNDSLAATVVALGARHLPESRDPGITGAIDYAGALTGGYGGQPPAEAVQPPRDCPPRKSGV